MARHADTWLARLGGRITAAAGIQPRRWVLLRRSEERAAARGMAIEDYLAWVGGEDAAPGAEEREQLLGALLVGETCFFRHADQVALLRERLLPERAARCRAEGRPLRLWSAGCATGEEAWTLAMLAAEVGEGAEVLGTDLSAVALRIAAAGRYPAAAGRKVPAALRSRYLVTAGEEIAIAPALRERVSVRFQAHNLHEDAYPVGFDAILCRNVLIYFSPEHRREVIERLRRSLATGGQLLLGPAEALNAVAGQAAGSGTEAPRRAKRASALSPITLRLSGSYGDGERLQRELRPYLAKGHPLVLDLDGAEYLGAEDARVLRRAREVLALRICGSKPGVKRWLKRHELG